MRWGKQVHSAFEHRLGDRRQPLPDNMRQWEGFAYPFDKYKVITEHKMGMTERATVTGFFDKDVWFRGISDAVVLQPEKAMAFILDFKTGNSKYEDPFELQTNALLLKIKYPELKKVVGSFAWLKENKMGQQHDLSDFKRTFVEIQRLMRLIAEKRVSGEWEKQKSGLCGWCDVADCEFRYVAEKK
jgi:hypothetical protein